MRIFYLAPLFLLSVITLNSVMVTDINAQTIWTIDTDLTNVPTNITGAQIDTAIANVSLGSPLIGLGNDIVASGEQYGINPIYITAHAAWESAWGTSAIAQAKNNLFGFGAYDSDPFNGAYTYDSFADCVDQVMSFVQTEYLSEGGMYYNGSTLRGMNVRYATDTNWGNGIASVMNSLQAHLPEPTYGTQTTCCGCLFAQTRSARPSMLLFEDVHPVIVDEINSYPLPELENDLLSVPSLDQLENESTAEIITADETDKVELVAEPIVPDLIPPTVSLQLAQGSSHIHTLHTNVFVDALDVDSAVTEMRFGRNGSWSHWQPYRPNSVISLDELGEDKTQQTITVQVRDAAGNESAVAEASVIVELNPDPPTSDNYTILCRTVNMGGTTKQSSTYQLTSSIGQDHETADLQGATYTVRSGFWGCVAPSTTAPTGDTPLSIGVSEQLTLETRGETAVLLIITTTLLIGYVIRFVHSKRRIS